MNVPLEISYRGVDKTESIDALIREKAERLERFCNYLSSCRIAVEKPQAHQERGSGYRVRIDMTVPLGHELVAHRGASEGEPNRGASARGAGGLRGRRTAETGNEAPSGAAGSGAGGGDFSGRRLRVLEDSGGRQIYFHRNSVINEDFEALRAGTGVRFVEEAGDKGPQATTVQVLSRRLPKQ
jgi:cold shock CspA family protein